MAAHTHTHTHTHTYTHTQPPAIFRIRCGVHLKESTGAQFLFCLHSMQGCACVSVCVCVCLLLCVSAVVCVCVCVCVWAAQPVAVTVRKHWVWLWFCAIVPASVTTARCAPSPLSVWQLGAVGLREGYTEKEVCWTWRQCMDKVWQLLLYYYYYYYYYSYYVVVDWIGYPL